MLNPRALARPAAGLTAALLLAGPVQAAPAAADPVGVALAVSVSASPLPGAGPGSSADDPARLGHVPGSAGLWVRVTNAGTEPLHHLAAVNRVLANGVVTEPHCDLSTLQPQPEVADDPVLDPGRSVLCRATVAEVMDGGPHEDVTTVTATGVDSGTPVSAEAHFYATAVDDSVEVGDRVWLDTDGDGVQDEGEPGIPGVTLTVARPDGSFVPDSVVPGSVVGPQTTAEDGTYAFTHLPPLDVGSHYTVTVDPTSPALEGLLPTRPGAGEPEVDSSTGTASSTGGLTHLGRDLTLDFGFVEPTGPTTPPAPLLGTATLTADASPEPAVKGDKLTVKGFIRREGKAYKTSTVLEFRGDDREGYSKVGTVKSNSEGALVASVTASRSGTFRYRFTGNSTTGAGVSDGDHVDVVLASVRVTVDASPETATEGGKLTIKGSIRRDGKKFRTTTVLEFRSEDSGDFTPVRSVRSSSKGALSATLTARRSGTFRYRFAGNGTTEAGVSTGDHVVVKPKPPSKPKPRAYKNCTELTEVYPHGVGRSGAEDKTRSGSAPVTDFTRDTATYNKNAKSDRDQDGIACER